MDGSFCWSFCLFVQLESLRFFVWLIDWMMDDKFLFLFLSVIILMMMIIYKNKQTTENFLLLLLISTMSMTFRCLILAFWNSWMKCMNEYLKSRNSWSYHQRFLWVIKVNCNQIKSIDWFNQFDRSRMSTNCLIDFFHWFYLFWLLFFEINMIVICVCDNRGENF